jgi:hypothetical protein
MEKQLMPHLQAKERKEYLENSADAVEDLGYTKPFKPEEIIVFKDDLSTTMIEYDILDGELDKIKDEYKAKMKPLKEETKELLTNIKNKAKFLNEKCYKFIEGQEAGYYNADGELVYQRPLLPGEAQKTIFSVKREGTND